MSRDQEAVLDQLVRLIRAENAGGAVGSHDAGVVLDEHAFMGFTRARGREQDRTQYLDELAGTAAADAPGSPNLRRWLDLAHPGRHPDFVPPQGAPHSADSGIEIHGDTALARVVVITLAAAAQASGFEHYRNLFVLVRRGHTWRVVAWQSTRLDPEQSAVPRTAPRHQRAQADVTGSQQQPPERQ